MEIRMARFTRIRPKILCPCPEWPGACSKKAPKFLLKRAIYLIWFASKAPPLNKNLVWNRQRVNQSNGKKCPRSWKIAQIAASGHPVHVHPGTRSQCIMAKKKEFDRTGFFFSHSSNPVQTRKDWQVQTLLGSQNFLPILRRFDFFCEIFICKILQSMENIYKDEKAADCFRRLASCRGTAVGRCTAALGNGIRLAAGLDTNKLMQAVNSALFGAIEL